MSQTTDTTDSSAVPKKRGRKPNGGKIIQQIEPTTTNQCSKPNIILHLKCSLDRKSTRLNSSHVSESRMPSSA